MNRTGWIAIVLAVLASPVTAQVDSIYTAVDSAVVHPPVLDPGSCTFFKGLQNPPAGSVQLKYVVGTNGRIEKDSFLLIATSNPSLVKPVQKSLLTCRFTPAEHEGRKVRMQVTQRLAFGSGDGDGRVFRPPAATVP